MAIVRPIALAATLSTVSGTAFGQFDCATTLAQQTFAYTDSWGWLGTNAAIVGDTLYQGIHWPGGVITRYDISDPSNIVELPSLQLPPYILAMLNGFTDINAGVLVRQTAVHGPEILWASWFGLTVLDTETDTFGWASTPDNPDFPWFTGSVTPMGRTAWTAGDQLARVDIDAMYAADGTPGNEWDGPIQTVFTPDMSYVFSAVEHAGTIFIGGSNSGGTPFVGTVDPMSNAFSGATLLSGGTATTWHATDSGFVVEAVGFSRLPVWDLEATPFPQSRITNLAANERRHSYGFGDLVFSLIASTGPMEMFVVERAGGSLSVTEFGDLTLPSPAGFPRGYEDAAMDGDGVVYLIANEGTQTLILPIDVSACLVSPACPGDIADDFGTLGADGMVGFGDFLALLGLVGPCPGGTPGCDGDIADDFGTPGADGMVSFGDFLALLGLVGPCP